LATSFWKGVISFGMVAIPVKMSIAIETKSLAFHYLHKNCHTLPKQVLYCAKDSEYFNTIETGVCFYGKSNSHQLGFL
jgi:DNA end-binding protein Ku